MKKILTAAAVALTLMFSASSASALDLQVNGGPNYVGRYSPPEPASASAEVGYINNLIDLAQGAGNTVVGGVTYNRVGSTVAGALPDASIANASKDETGNNSFNLSNYTGYIVGKYDGPNGFGFVWYLVNFSGPLTVPTDGESCAKGCGLSHVSFYGNVGVPDGGTTLSLLGLGFLGLGFLRRRLS